MTTPSQMFIKLKKLYKGDSDKIGLHIQNKLSRINEIEGRG